jgi:hypothetical protein
VEDTGSYQKKLVYVYDRNQVQDFHRWTKFLLLFSIRRQGNWNAKAGQRAGLLARHMLALCRSARKLQKLREQNDWTGPAKQKCLLESKASAEPLHMGKRKKTLQN